MNLIKSKLFRVLPPLKPHILLFDNGLPDIRPIKVNKGLLLSILYSIKLKYFRVHPSRKPHTLFYKGLAI